MCVVAGICILLGLVRLFFFPVTIVHKNAARVGPALLSALEVQSHQSL